MHPEGPSAQPTQYARTGRANPRQAAGWVRKLEGLARNHPLFEHRSSLEALQRAAALPSPRVVSIGLGLCAPNAVSQGVPLDVLAMVLCADSVREAVGARATMVIIADAHAVASGLPETEVTAQADRMEGVVRRVARACKLELTTVRASTMHRSEDHRAVHVEVLAQAGADTPPYLTLETADTETLQRHYGGLLKLGWSLGGSSDNVRDERFFDAHYTRWVGGDATFTYIKAGRTLSAQKPRTAPYVVVDPNQRLLLDPKDDLRGKLARAAGALPRDRYRAAVKHYGHVVSAYASHTRPLRGSLADRVEGLLTHLFAHAEDATAREAAE